MKTSKLFGCFAALAVTASAVANEPANQAELTEEEESPISIEVSLDVMSDYVFRGYISNDNPVWQPAVELAYEVGDFGGVYANVWSTFDLTRKRGTYTNSRRACGLQEIDYTVGYCYSIEDFESDFLKSIDFEVAHIWYTYPNNNGATERDLYANVSFVTPFITPSASVYWLYGGVEGTDRSTFYYEFALSHDFEIAFADESILTVTPQALLGIGGNAWCQYMVGDDRSFDMEMCNQTIGLAASYAITENLSLGAQINYTWTPSKTLRHWGYMEGGEGNKHQLVWGGVNVTYSF